MANKKVQDDLVKAMQSIVQNADALDKKSEKIRGRWTSLNSTFQSISQSYLGFLNSVTKTDFSKGVSDLLPQLSKAIEMGYQDTSAIRAEQTLATSAVRQMLKMQREGKKIDEEALKLKRAEVKAAKQIVAEAEKNHHLLNQVEKLSLDWFDSLGIFVLNAWRNIHKTIGNVNRELVEANNLTKTRGQLLKTIYMLQADTGDRLTDITASAKALVNYGFENQTNFKALTKQVTMANSALGITVEQSATLANIYEKRLGGPGGGLHRTLNLISQISDETALAAAEAANYAEQLGVAAMFLGSSRSKGSAASIGDYALRLEGAIKESGGVQGEITALLSRVLTTTEGAMTAARFGLTQGQVSTASGQQQMFKSISDIVKQMQTARSSGNQLQYTASLELLQDILGDQVSARTLNSFVDAFERTQNVTKSNLGLQERWNKQIAANSETLGRAINVIMTMVRRGFMPLIDVSATISSFFLKLVTILNKIPGLATVIAATVTTVAVGAIAGLIQKFFQMAGAVRILTRELNKSTIAAGVNAKATRLRNAQAGGMTLLGGAGRRGGKVKAIFNLTKLFDIFKRGLLGIGRFLITSSFIPAVLAGLAGAGVGTFIQKKFIEPFINPTVVAGSLLRTRREAIDKVFSDLVRDNANPNAMGGVRDSYIKTILEKHKALMQNDPREAANIIAQELQPLLEKNIRAAEAVVSRKSAELQIANELSAGDLKLLDILEKQLSEQKTANEQQRQMVTELLKSLRSQAVIEEEKEERSRADALRSIRRRRRAPNTIGPALGY